MRIVFRLLMASVAALLLNGCQSVLFNALKAPTLGQKFSVEAMENSEQPHLLADVYRPREPLAGSPTVVFLYGGSWRNGKRSWYRFVGASLAEAGITVVIPDYRKAPEVHFPVFVEDVARVVAFVHTHIDRFGGDPQQLFLMGHSAGAHITALLCTDARYLRAVGMSPADIRGMIGLAGPYDFLPMTGPDVIEVFNGDANNAASQPVNFVDGDEPPMLLLHGADDKLVWPTNSRSLDGHLRAAGRDSTLKVYADVGHVGILLSLGRGFRRWSPALADSLAWIRGRSGAPAAGSP